MADSRVLSVWQVMLTLDGRYDTVIVDDARG